MSFVFNDAVRNAQAQAIVDAFDAGPGPGYIEIYDGAQPSKNGPATNLLGTLVLSSPSAASITNGVLTLDGVTSDSDADAGGDATWFRMKDSTGVFVADGNISVTGGGATLQFDNITITAGGAINISSFVITMGNG